MSMHCMKFALAAVGVLVATAPGLAQTLAPTAPAPTAPALTAPTVQTRPPLTEARKVLNEAANALGMVRGIERSLTVVNMFAFTADGTLAKGTGGPEPVTRFTADYDYVIPASRFDVERPGAEPQR